MSPADRDPVRLSHEAIDTIVPDGRRLHLEQFVADMEREHRRRVEHTESLELSIQNHEEKAQRAVQLFDTVFFGEVK